MKQNQIIQLTDGEYTRNTLSTESVSKKITRFVKAIIKRGDYTLVVSTKMFIRKLWELSLTPGLDSKLKLSYYHDNCDKDELMRYDQIILVGKPDIQYQMYQRIHYVFLPPYPNIKIWILTKTPMCDNIGLNKIKFVNGDELATILNLKAYKNAKLIGLNPACTKLGKAITKLRCNGHVYFTTRKLAETAEVSPATVRIYTERLCRDIPDLIAIQGGFLFHKN